MVLAVANSTGSNLLATLRYCQSAQRSSSERERESESESESEREREREKELRLYRGHLQARTFPAGVGAVPTKAETDAIAGEWQSESLSPIFLAQFPQCPNLRTLSLSLSL